MPPTPETTIAAQARITLLKSQLAELWVKLTAEIYDLQANCKHPFLLIYTGDSDLACCPQCGASNYNPETGMTRTEDDFSTKVRSSEYPGIVLATTDLGLLKQIIEDVHNGTFFSCTDLIQRGCTTLEGKHKSAALRGEPVSSY